VEVTAVAAVTASARDADAVGAPVVDGGLDTEAEAAFAGGVIDPDAGADRALDTGTDAEVAANDVSYEPFS
jgi:hypothetical protein